MFRVLLPIDGDAERATAGINAVLSLPDAPETVEVTILNVQTEIDVKDDVSVSSEEWYDETNFPESVTEVQEKLEQEDVSVNMERKHANVTEAILETADEINADRIIMSGRKRTPAGKVLFGSTTQSVLLNADVPVTVAVVD